MSHAFRIAKTGKNVLAPLTGSNINDFIFVSDVNTPKIISEGKNQPSLAPNGSESFHAVSHGQSYTPFTFGFCKFDNNRVGLPGTKQSNKDFWFTNLRVNNTNVSFGYLNLEASSQTPYWKYLTTEVPLAGTPSFSQEHSRRIVIAKPGFNAFIEENPNNIIFDSRWGSLKYFNQGKTTIDLPETNPTTANVIYTYEVVLYTHNLGYYPFFGGTMVYAADPTIALTMPEVIEDAGFINRHFIYTTTTQIIFRWEGGDLFGGFIAGGYQVDVYYKVYSRDLGL